MRSEILSIFLSLPLLTLQTVGGIISDNLQSRRCVIKDSILSIAINKKPTHVYYFDVQANTEGEFDCKANATHGHLTCRTTTSDSFSSPPKTMYIVFIKENNDYKRICIAGNVEDESRNDSVRKSDSKVTATNREIYRRYRIIRDSGIVFLGLVIFVIVFLIGVIVVWKVYGDRKEKRLLQDQQQKQQHQPQKNIHLRVIPSSSQYP